ncbi:tRNA (cytosine(72)-C(5))-methyltransferase NSUN6-like [Amphibalanus amphitrite]|uniref:tRNA (cytosine(72)-C(5))-methyltransferase NSUN6-like n=1 Tax=Amphibalanus amphitrite TaxID=1232801 RepID=UPI001C90B662|nr:tRNA (cytosine(72)-C(5))-methyltransferase NSUN6-like [Amphibalanus amphitrite]XP_043237341.1 tRNA (cytosine(72)-C(5))-methyltransferase NSUN6-like [Amphibalanus amphitrite]
MSDDVETEGSSVSWTDFRYSTAPRFSTIRVNMGDKESESMEDDLKDYLRKLYPDVAYRVFRHGSLPELLVVRADDRPPPTPGHCQLIVDALCGAAVLRGADVYAPGVLGCPAELLAGDAVAVYADRDGRCLRGRTQPYAGATTFVGNGVMQLSRRELFTTDRPSGVAVRVTQPVFGAPSLGPLCGRRAMLQNIPSALTSRVLAPRPGELVLDMCAAPGGKTTHLAQLMQNQGLLYAFDRTAAKVARIAALAEEQLLSCVHALRADSTRLLSADSACRLRRRHLTGEPCPLHADGPCAPPFAPDTFDRVLVDAPCSGLGQRPRLTPPAAGAQLRSYGPLQRRLLAVGADLVRPGGRLVYSTCTVPPAENEAQVAAALVARPRLRLEPAEPRLGGPGLPGHGLDADQCGRVQRFVPQPESDCCDRDTIGFFIACFSKAES